MSTAPKSSKGRRPFRVVAPGDLDQMPPFNAEAEKSVLGSIMLDPVTLTRVRTILTPDDFFVSEHRGIYEAILAVEAAGKPIDLQLVDDQLQSWNQLERVGGYGAYRTIVEATPHAVNAEYYAKIVHDKAVKRGLITAANEILHEAYSNVHSAEKLLDLARSSVDGIAQRAARGIHHAGGYATLADADSMIGKTRWLWDDWIPRSVMTLLAAKAGEGKTRTAMDLVRRLWYGMPFPDGSPNPYPPGTKSLWLLVDRNWGETAAVARSFGVPLEAIHLHSPRRAPLTTPELDDPTTTAALDAQIRELNPGLVIIDTITYATNRNTARAEEAKAAFDALLNLAASTGVPILALTHLNKEGEALNRRITERARSVLSLSYPDPEGQRDRRKLWVSKSATKKPNALGITFRDDGNEYDDAPPTEPGKKAPGPAPIRKGRNAEWLWDQLQAGPAAVSLLVERARADGLLSKPTEETPKPSISPLYTAKEYISELHPGQDIEEFEVCDPDHGNRAYKHWRIAASPPGDERPAF